MKKSEIKIGHIYSNGKGRLRKVINDVSKANRTAGEQHNMTLAAFASWCKEEVE